MTNFYQWDHTVHYINDLQQAEQIFQQHGLISKYGGKHPAGGTENSLSYFGLTYLEFLSVFDLKLVQETHQLISRDAAHYLPEKEAFSRIALRTQNIEQAQQKLSAYTLDLSPIFSGSRRTATGDLLTWKLLTISGNFLGLPYPFIISWEISDNQRLANLTHAKLLDQHQLSNVKVKEGIFNVSDPERITAHWSEIFGLEKITPRQLNLDNKLLTFEKGDHNQLETLVLQNDSLYEAEFSIGQGHYRLTAN